MIRRNKVVIGIIVAVLVIVGVILAIYFSINDASQKPKTTVTVRYAAPLTIAAAPVYVAASKGFWADEGIDMKVTDFDSGRKALDALLSNNADVMSVSETPPLRAYLAGSNINIVTTVTEHKEAKMTVRTDRISKPSDVKGKKIGTVAGTNSDYYMYRWLDANGLKPSDVTIVPLDAGSLSQAFVQGDVDVMFAWEPYNYNAVSKIPNLAKSWPTELYTGRHTVVMNDDYSQKNPEIVKEIIKGFVKAEDYIKSNPTDAKKIVMEKTGMSQAALDGLWGEYTYKVELDDQLLSIINNEATWIKSTEGNPSTRKGVDLVNSSFLLKVDSSLVGGSFRS
ncbi:MAG TPA: ABC transporter substrate-binding protein [Candidatus Microsaccharimonas sp.]|jgi:NitT/TauT family transport system substrate-binding protein